MGRWRISALEYIPSYAYFVKNLRVGKGVKNVARGGVWGVRVP